MVEDVLRGSDINLDVVVTVCLALRVTAAWGKNVAPHEKQAGSVENPGRSLLDKREIGVRPDRNDSCVSLDALFQQSERIIQRSRSGSYRLGPVRRFIGKSRSPTIAAECDVSSSGDRYIISVGEIERVSSVARALASIVRDRRDSDQLDVGPRQDHRQRAKVVDVSANVGVDMEFRHYRPFGGSCALIGIGTIVFPQCMLSTAESASTIGK